MKKFLQHSPKGSALLIGLVVTVLVSIIVIGFLEKVLRVGTGVKSIEQSTQAHYLAVGTAERALNNTTELKREPWTIQEIHEWTESSYSGASLDIFTTSDTIPKKWYGNSPFNKDYNIISVSQPLQIVVPDGLNWSSTDFEFKIPKIGNESTTKHSTEESTTSTWLLLWTIGNAEKILYASGSSSDGLFTGIDIGWNRKIDAKNGYFYNNSILQNSQFGNFYNNTLGPDCHDYKCTFKLSILRPLRTSRGELSFLEYKISFGASADIPNQYMIIDASGRVNGYTRTRRILIPQITTNTALDFAVLQ